MAERVTLGESFIITIFSMAIVFVGLIVLAVLISALKNIGNENKKVKEANNVAKEPEKEQVNLKPVVEISNDNNINDEELVAVIAASIATSLGVSIPEVKIRSIKRVPQNTPVWALAGRHEAINSKIQK